jgi:hypothetical protein
METGRSWHPACRGAGGGRHGLQLWTSLPPAQKSAEPAYTSYRASEIPAIRRDGVTVRILAGALEDATGPMTLATPTVFAHAQLDAGAAVQRVAGDRRRGARAGAADLAPARSRSWRERSSPSWHAGVDHIVMAFPLLLADSIRRNDKS